MIAKLIRGAGFRGALDYVFREREDGKGRPVRPRVIAGNMSSIDARGLAAEFKAARRLRPDIKRPVWHCPIAFAPGEHLDDPHFAAVLGDYMNQMGFGAMHQWVAVIHEECDHLHAHILASRVALDANVWTGVYEARRAIAACRLLEDKHGLRPTATVGAPAGKVLIDMQQRLAKSVVREQVHKANRRALRKGTQMNDSRAICAAVCEAVDRANNIEQLEWELARRGVEIEFVRRPNSEIYGWKLRSHGALEWLKGSSISRHTTWPRVAAALDRHASPQVRVLERTGQGHAAQHAGNHAQVFAQQVITATELHSRQPLAPATVKRLIDLPHILTPLPSPTGVCQPHDRSDNPPLLAQQPNLVLQTTLGHLKEWELRRLREIAERRPPESGDGALVALLHRLVDLILRILSFGTVGLPPTEVERKATARGFLLQEINVELDRRTEQRGETPPSETATVIVRTFDARPVRKARALEQDEQVSQHNPHRHYQ